MKDTPPSDIEIVQSVLAGDIEQFALLITRYKSDVFAVIHGHVPYEAVEELAQETFVRSFEKLYTYKQVKPFKNWLITIAVSKCMDFWRKSARSQEISASVLGNEDPEWFDSVTPVSDTNPFEVHMEDREKRILIEKALENLSPDDKILIGLIYKEEMTHAEIAQILGWSIPRVKVRAHRARNKLRRVLADSSIVQEGNYVQRD